MKDLLEYKKKAILIDYEYYIYPKNYQDLDSFISYINKSNDKFIPLNKLLQNNCVSPYFIEEETQKKYINFSVIPEIEEVDVTILPKEEYEKRLLECVNKHCIDCVSYEESKDGDNLVGHRDKISLDGLCRYKRKR